MLGSAEPVVPGSSSPGYVPETITAVASSAEGKQLAARLGIRGLQAFTMGECRIVRYIDPERGLTMTVRHPERLPSWDEIKQARYRLLPRELTFCLLLPPPSEYADDPRNPFVIELHTHDRPTS